MRQKIISCVRGKRLRDYAHTRREVARLCPYKGRGCAIMPYKDMSSSYRGMEWVCMYGVHVSWGPAPLKKVTTNTNCVPYLCPPYPFSKDRTHPEHTWN